MLIQTKVAMFLFIMNIMSTVKRTYMYHDLINERKTNNYNFLLIDLCLTSILAVFQLYSGLQLSTTINKHEENRNKSIFTGQIGKMSDWLLQILYTCKCRLLGLIANTYMYACVVSMNKHLFKNK